MVSRDELHTKLDAQCDLRRQELESELAQLEQDRDRGHEWIDAVPDAVLAVFGQSAVGRVGDSGIHPVTGTFPVRPLWPFKPLTTKVPLYEPIRNLIRSLDPDREIATPIIYDALLQTVPELKMEDQRKLKARIAGTLSRLADEQVLKVWKSGSGSVPHTYKIVGPRKKTLGEVFGEVFSEAKE